MPLEDPCNPSPSPSEDCKYLPGGSGVATIQSQRLDEQPAAFSRCTLASSWLLIVMAALASTQVNNPAKPWHVAKKLAYLCVSAAAGWSLSTAPTFLSSHRHGRVLCTGRPWEGVEHPCGDAQRPWQGQQAVTAVEIFVWQPRWSWCESFCTSQGELADWLHRVYDRSFHRGLVLVCCPEGRMQTFCACASVSHQARL